LREQFPQNVSLSQRIFALFKSRYIDTKRNLFDDVDAISDSEFLGATSFETAKNEAKGKLQDLIEGTRSLTKSFIVYQLANKQAGTGAGVGCGYYDTIGTADGGEIARLMNDYIFEVCFNPAINEQNANQFLDYCLRNLSSGFWSEGDEDGYFPTEQSLVGELSESRLADYWIQHGTAIKEQNFISSNKRVITLNYVVTYADDLLRVFGVLDKIQSKYEADRNGK
jgi:hypothetical protein